MTQFFPQPERPEEPESERENQPSETGENAEETLFSEPPQEWQPETAERTPAVGAPQEEPVEPLPEPPVAEDEQTLMAEGAAYQPRPEAPQGMNPVESEGGETFAEARGDETLAEGAAAPAAQPAPAAPAAAAPMQRLSPEDERTWSMIAHLSMLLNLVTGFLGPVAALAVYLMYKDRSKTVAFHAMQSFVFQIITWIGGGLLIGAIWIITGLLSAVIIGLLCIPFAVLFTVILAAVPIVGLVYSIVGAIQVNSGQPFSYWLVGDWVKGMLD